MKLDERFWIGGGGLTAQWRAVVRHRVKDALSRLDAAAKTIGAKAPAEVRKRDYAAGFKYFISRGGLDRDALAVHPALDYWLFLWDRHFNQPCGVADWHLQLGLFQCFPAWLALGRGDRLELDSALDPAARFHFYGSPYSLSFPERLERAPIKISVADKRFAISGPDKLKAALSLGDLGTATAAGSAKVFRCPEIAPGMIVEEKAWLLTHGVTMHGLASQKPKQRERFAEVLRQALKDLEAQSPGFAAELRDMVSVLVPLENPMKFGSVSSSYVSMRGAIGLSHAEDPLLQAETLIHEFCHQKMNQLLTVEPILLPGQAGQVFYSPWRKDARRLRGLLLGAHAFLNVAKYLLKFLRAEDSFRKKERIDVMLNVAQRLYQVEDALRTVSLYGTLTDFGREFTLGMWRELGLLYHGVQWFPAALLKEARDHHLEHRAKHALFDTGFHRTEDFVDKVERAPFLTPGGVEALAAKTSVE